MRGREKQSKRSGGEGLSDVNRNIDLDPLAETQYSRLLFCFLILFFLSLPSSPLVCFLSQ